jgi:dihydropteroate synthase
VSHPAYAVPLAQATLALGQAPVVMGILNVTPDSFSDGGRHNKVVSAVAHARLMYDEGAAIIDLGGESTRPGAEELPTQDELDRVMPVLDGLKADAFPGLLSIDTYKAVVADQAMQAGAHIINDVRGLWREPEIADVAQTYACPLILMHWDLERDRSRDVIDEICRYFDRSIEIATRAGIGRDRIVLDPGFGFSKTIAENYEILRRFAELHHLGFPLLAGTSRKSMIGKVLDNQPGERAAGTIATNVLAYQAGAHIFRVHDVKLNRDALLVTQATLYGPPAGL